MDDKKSQIQIEMASNLPLQIAGLVGDEFCTDKNLSKARTL